MGRVLGFCLLALGLMACGSDGSGGGGAGAAGTGGSGASGGASGSGGAAGTGAVGGSAGASGTGGTSSYCGDGTIDTGEQCDGSDLNGATCESLGAGAGTLQCDATGCQYVLWDCSCGGDAVSSLPASLQGETNALMKAKLNSKCVSTVQGPSKSYTFTASADMSLDVKLTSSAQLYATVRKSCTLGAFDSSPFTDELGCAYDDGTAATVALAAGDQVYIVVQSRDYGAAPAPFTLELSQTP